MPDPALLSGLRVMIVEDEAMVSMMIEDMLGAIGCVVVGMAASLTRGLAMVDDDALALDAAVLDVNLSGEKVYPIAERLAAKHVPFIFSTGYGHQGLAEQFARVPTLTKPFGAPQLEAMLISALGQGRA